jgi:hypothetical protein
MLAEARRRARDDASPERPTVTGERKVAGLLAALRTKRRRHLLVAEPEVQEGLDARDAP